jgi:hypothetical protein
VNVPNEGNRPDVEQDVDEDLDQVVMAVDVKERGTVGCAYYVAQEEKLCLFGDVQSGGGTTIEIRMSNRCSISDYRIEILRLI